MRRKSWTGVISAAVVGVAVAIAVPAVAQQYYPGMMGPGMMGPGMMGPGMMGYGMMGRGAGGYGMMPCGPMMGYGGMMGMMRGYPPAFAMGPRGTPGRGMMGPGAGRQPGQAADQISTDDVQRALERRLAIMGNPHLKVGAVKQSDDKTITADIVTTDKEGLVERFSIDRETGIWRPE